MNNLKLSLKQYFGFNEFRPGQAQTIAHLLNGHSSLAIFPTGSGKSLCYQLTALHLPHLTLVVSPLLALMKDQLSFLKSKGIAAASLDSSLSADEYQQVINDVKQGTLKILMVSVERFKNERFRQLMASINISMLVVDEAHCISEWGHNFRPDYLKLPFYQQHLNIPLVLLLTATATPKVTKDMAAKFAISACGIIQTGFYRNNLNISVLAVPEMQKRQQLCVTLKQQQGTGIVYTTLQQSAEQVADFLCQQGLNARAYHAGLGSELREQIQQDFMAGVIDIIVATIAFGMGVDKANVRFVVHYDLPKSIENYSQEIGRAGRDGLPSNCITFAERSGLNTLENFVYGDTPELAGIDHVVKQIAIEQDNGLWEHQGLSLSTASNIRQLPLKTLLVQLELKGVLQAKYSYFADFKYKLLCSEEEISRTFNEERQTFIRAIFTYSDKKKIWAEPNFERINLHYPSDRARVITALEYLAEKGFIELAFKKLTEVFQVNVAALNSPTLAQELYQYFVDKEQSEIERIHRLITFFESKSCLTFQLADYFGDSQAPQQCGHCSVCLGKSITLPMAEKALWLTDEQLINYCAELKQQLAGKENLGLSSVNYARFLAGIMAPMFSRNKVSSMAGFGSCQQHTFKDIFNKIEFLTSQL